MADRVEVRLPGGLEYNSLEFITTHFTGRRYHSLNVGFSGDTDTVSLDLNYATSHQGPEKKSYYIDDHIRKVIASEDDTHVADFSDMTALEIMKYCLQAENERLVKKENFATVKVEDQGRLIRNSRRVMLGGLAVTAADFATAFTDMRYPEARATLFMASFMTSVLAWAFKGIAKSERRTWQEKVTDAREEIDYHEASLIAIDDGNMTEVTDEDYLQIL
jgi:hypothetical protein